MEFVRSLLIWTGVLAWYLVFVSAVGHLLRRRQWREGKGT